MANEFGRASDRDYPYRVKVASVANWQSDTKLKDAGTAYWSNTDIPNFADPSQDPLAEKRKLEKLEEQEQEEEEEE